LSEGATRLWGQPGEIFASTSALPVDDLRINELLAMIVRGLFMHDFGEALHKYWDVRVTMFRPNDEAEILNQVLRFLGSNPLHVKRNLGRGTFNYEGYSGRMMRNCSVWQFTLFSGLAVADDEIALSRFSAITTRRDDVQGPLSERSFREEARLPDAACANLSKFGKFRAKNASSKFLISAPLETRRSATS
jgi:hypothetical protein